MVLEEEIWFSSEEEAQECLQILRKLNVTAHIRTKVDLKSRVRYKAPYTSLKGLIEEEITRIQNAGKDGSEECITEFQEVLDNLKIERDLLAKTFAEKSPGDHISTTVFDFLIRDGTIPDTEETMAEFLKEATLTRLLELNNLLDIDGKGMILVRTLQPDEAFLDLFEDEMPPLMEESLKNWSIKRSLDSRDIISYIVTTSPEVVFLEDLTELEEFFDRIKYDEEKLFFFVNLQVKQVLIAEIISMIQKEGKSSKDDLISDFLNRELPIEDEMISIGLHLSPGFIEDVLDDLKKTGILKGKDSKLKIVI